MRDKNLVKEWHKLEITSENIFFCQLSASIIFGQHLFFNDLCISQSVFKYFSEAYYLLKKVDLACLVVVKAGWSVPSNICCSGPQPFWFFSATGSGAVFGTVLIRNVI